jgi:HAD superfamily hydrolase (TIGR01544 family)
MKNKSSDQILKHFQVKDKDKSLRKLNKIITEGKEKLHLLADFDRTLTVGRNETGKDTSSWEILATHLPPKAFAKQHQLYEKYRPMELSGKMTHEEAASWGHQVLSIFVESKINLKEIEKDFRQKTDIRPYAKDLFDFCNTFAIPTVILSAGIGEIIDLWAKTFQVSPTLVLATRLITDKNGNFIDWNRDIIHHLNKNEQGRKELTKINKQRPNAILIGDALEDADMSNGDENVLRIRVHNPREDEGISKTDFDKKTFEKFDLMIENGTLEPVLKILEAIW